MTVASLRVLGADGSEKVVELRERKVQIGRGRDNDIVLDDAQKGVSRTHAELRYENGRYVIVDLQSQNGTWVNGRRVERSEVPSGAEIMIGDYCLKLQTESVAAGASPASGATIVRPLREPDDVQIRRQPSDVQHRLARAQPTVPLPAVRQPAVTEPGGPRWIRGAALIIGAVLLFGAVAWVWGPRGRVAGQPGGGDPTPSDARPAEPSTPVATEPAPADRSGEPAAPVRPKSERVARKPGESVEAWKARGEALETRYSYSQAALDRRDYAAAAGGFQAILLEEPGFRDAPQLLVQANAGLRATASAVFESGKRLDADGDWLGALQKYEQARQIYSGLPGVTEAMQRARERLRAAGARALAQARQLDAAGRSAEALKEYEKAVQWLPADDPNRQAARMRLEQLKRND